MASSSSETFDHSNSEIKYECFSIIDGNICKRDEVYVKCPLCKHLGQCFYCAECVRNGNFIHSKTKCYERFADKKVTKYKLDDEKAQLLQRYENVFSKKKRIENLKLEIYKSKENIKLLEASIKSCNESILKDNERIKELKNYNADKELNRSQCINKLSDLRDRHTLKTEEIESADSDLNRCQSALQKCVQHRTSELVKHIFPITRVTSQVHKSSSSDEGQSAELEEAQKITYVVTMQGRGEWIMPDVQYSVVEPCIPSSGDYSAYFTLTDDHIQATSRDSLTELQKQQFDTAYGISAALAYTAQFTNVLAFLMDVNVPKKCTFNDFCGYETSKTKFLHKVAKLNTNIISLCLSQGVDMSKVNAHHTIKNLLVLLESEKQSKGEMSEDELHLLESIEDSLSKDLVNESDSDDLETEFVHVSEKDFEDDLEVPYEAPAEPAPAQVPEPSLVSSVLSLFKAAAGQR